MQRTYIKTFRYFDVQKNVVNEKSILLELAQVFQDGPNGLHFLSVSQRNHKIQMLKTIISIHIETGLTQSTWDNALRQF